MASIPGKISKDNFKKAISGGKNYLPQKISRELKAAGMSRLLYGGQTTKQQTVKAIKHLQNQGLLSKTKPPSKLYREAGIRQREQNQAAADAERQKHVRANIAIDIAEELAAEERGENPMKYDPKSVLGKRLIDELDEEKENRDKKAAAEKQKMQRLSNPKNPGPPKPDSADADELPDMDIG